MKRVLVIGCGGAGKTRLARELGARTGLPVVHLDQEFWHPGWVETPPDEWAARVRTLTAADEWIMDGNYGGTMEQRLEAADTAVFLDYPTAVCVIGVLRRVAEERLLGRRRPDSAEGCPERVDLTFLRYVLAYRRTRRPGVLARLEARAADTDVVILTGRRAAARWLNNVQPRPGWPPPGER